MTLEGIEKAIQDKSNNQKYEPEPISSDLLITDLSNGTFIKLTELNRKRLSKSVTAMKKMIARRFSVIGSNDNFNVYVNEEKIQISDKEDRRISQLVWIFNNSEKQDSFPNAINCYDLPEKDPSWSSEWKIKGWLGTASEPKQLKDSDLGNLNGILVMSRGRIFQENILDMMNDHRLYSEYITGVIEADFLDDDDKEDIATSDRQRVIEDDPRFQSLIRFIKSTLNTIEKTWSSKRVEIKQKEALKESPMLAEWIGTLSNYGGHQEQARKMIGLVSSLRLTGTEDQQKNTKTELYRSAILSFERLKLRGDTERFVNAIENNHIDVMQIISDFDIFEASLYSDIIKNRLEIIKILEKMIDSDEPERELQKYLFDHMWLLDPSWERVQGSERLEQSIKKDFEKPIAQMLTQEERDGRVDIRYRVMAGKHVIIEMKKSSISPTAEQLVPQGRKYISALRKCLEAVNIRNEPIEVIFLLGKCLSDQEMPAGYAEKLLESINGRVKTYRELIQSALQSYSAYLEVYEKHDNIKRIVENL